VLQTITELQSSLLSILEIQEFKKLGEIAECFRKSAELFSPPIVVEPIEIPYKQTTLPGYLYKVNGYSHNHDDGKQPKSRRPTLIAHGGIDSTLEELC
jgi:hypothetical protein